MNNKRNNFFCGRCGKSKLGSNETSCDCSQIKPNLLKGWVCPLCNSVLSPYTNKCECKRGDSDQSHFIDHGIIN